VLPTSAGDFHPLATAHAGCTYKKALNPKVEDFSIILKLKGIQAGLLAPGHRPCRLPGTVVV